MHSGTAGGDICCAGAVICIFNSPDRNLRLTNKSDRSMSTNNHGISPLKERRCCHARIVV